MRKARAGARPRAVVAEAEAEAAVARNLTLHPLLRGACACAWWVGEVRWAPTQLNFGLRDLCPSYEPVPPGEWTDGEGSGRERDERERGPRPPLPANSLVLPSPVELNGLTTRPARSTEIYCTRSNFLCILFLCAAVGYIHDIQYTSDNGTALCCGRALAPFTPRW